MLFYHYSALQYAAVAAAGTEISATTDALALAEKQATVNAETNVLAGTDALALTTYPASLSADTSVSATTDALALIANAANVNAETSIAATVDALTLTEYPATVTALVGTNIIATTDALALTEYPVTLTYDREVLATVDALTLNTYAASISTGVALTNYAVATGAQMLATKRDSKFPLEVSVDSSGGVTGLTIAASIRDVNNSASYLDFDDLTFKTSAWVAKTLELTDLTGGFYGTTLDIAGITNLPSTKSLAVEYAISGTVTAVTSSFMTFLDDYLTTSKFIGLS